VTKHLRRHWPTTRIVWRGDGHYGRVEAMDWADEHDNIDYIFGLAGNVALDALVAETADNLRFHHAKSSQTKLRTYASFTYQAGSWTRPRKVVARLECSLQPDVGGTTSNGMRQEVDIRYVVTSLKGSAQHLYENVYCQRESRPRKSGQDDRWSFCLTAGTLCPRIRRYNEQTHTPDPHTGLQGEGGVGGHQGREHAI
jgi:hypothetical protein